MIFADADLFASSEQDLACCLVDTVQFFVDLKLLHFFLYQGGRGWGHLTVSSHYFASQGTSYPYDIRLLLFNEYWSLLSCQDWMVSGL